MSVFSSLIQALNILWNCKNHVDGERGKPDSAAFRDLLLSIPASRQQRLSQSAAVQNLARFTPPILNHSTIQTSHAYSPGRTLTPTLRSQASREHRKLTEAVDGWNNTPNEENRANVLKKLAALLYVVRSNIAHGEKSLHGPDLAKAQRDKQVCEIARPAADAVVEAVFDRPSQKLIVYGTLSPGGPNHKILNVVADQKWADCEIVGEMRDRNGLKSFEWRKCKAVYYLLV